MTTPRYHTSGTPKPQLPESLRRHLYGPVEPMALRELDRETDAYDERGDLVYTIMIVMSVLVTFAVIVAVYALSD